MIRLKRRAPLLVALSPRSSSRARTPMDLPLSRTSRTVRALNSVVNTRRLRLAVTDSYRTFVRSGVSTKTGAGSAAASRARRAILAFTLSMESRSRAGCSAGDGHLVARSAGEKRRMRA
jgi:hypothetical protein